MVKRIETYRHRTIPYSLFPIPYSLFPIPYPHQKTFTANAALREQQALINRHLRKHPKRFYD